MTKEKLNLEEEYKKLQIDEENVNNENSLIEKKIGFYKNFAWILISVGAFIGIFGFVVHTLGWNWNLNLFGDYIGGVVASTWSLAGLFIIYVAFLAQKQQLLQQQMELKYNRFEVKATRKEFEGQKEQMIEQNKTLKQQRFENTFFQMLNLHHQIVNSIDIKDGNHQNQQGRDAFKLIYNNFRGEMTNKIKNDFGIILKIYLKYYSKNQSDLGHYFRNLYHIIKLVKNSDIEDKLRYTTLVRAQLSSYELLLLFYNCLSSNGKEKFKPLVEEFHLLKNMPQNELVYGLDKDQYDPSAYGKLKRVIN